MKFTERTRTVVTLAGFAVLFIALTVTSYVRESATWDEPQHLTTGYAALTRGDYRIDPEHPPFLRLWAALPLLAQRDIKLDTRAIDATDPAEWAGLGQFHFCHDFLYRQNDADRLLYPARFMIVLLGVLLGILVFCWARELFGYWPAVLALALYTLEPNILAHSRLVTTDLGVVCFIVGALYFLWRTTRRVSLGNVTGLVVFFALAQVSKFSAVLMWPVVGLLLLGWAARTRQWRTAVVVGALLVATTWLAIWAVYRFRYAPSPNPQWTYRFDLAQNLPVVGQAAGWVDRQHLLPNGYTQGFLLGQAKALQRSAFLAGQYSNDGWWYYFPVAFLIKTPVTLLLLGLGGLVLCATRRQSFRENEVFLLLPVVVFLAATMSAKLNIGLRHILVVYPLVILLAAKTGHSWLRVPSVGAASRPRPAEEIRRIAAWTPLLPAIVLGALSLFEFGRVSPHYLASFNSFVGGPRAGYHYLLDSNLDWGQDLKGLKRWMTANHVPRINLCYFGTADPAYYGIECTYLPGGPFFAEAQAAAPQLPGYVAVSATQLQGVYLPEQWRIFYRKLQQQPAVAVIGHSIHVYRVERPWWR